MIISGFSHAQKGEYQVLSASFRWEDCERPTQEIFFRYGADSSYFISENYHPFLLAAVIPALRYGERRIQIEGAVCPWLKDNLNSFMAYMTNWFWYKYARKKNDPRLVTIEAASLKTAYQAPARTASFFSGGVDSSVAAHLLIEQGHEVIGVFMKNWHDTDFTISEECPWEEDSKDALLVAEKLGIPFHTIDLSEEYYERIVSYMFKEYESGRTPNPDVLCNREIKFDTFLMHALKLGADYVATGHYCRKGESESGFELLAGKDGNKDQSYFLCQVSQEQLAKVLFPIGEIEKPEVRRIAKEQDLITAEKRDSQGLCFIGKVKLPDFLKQQLKEKKGNVVEIARDWEGYNKSLKPTEEYEYSESDGKIVGEHTGAHFYTIGQRRGLNIGGYVNPLFIIQTNTKTNTIYVGEGEDHRGLSRPGLFIPTEDEHWINSKDAMEVGETRAYKVRIRYRQPLVNSEIERTHQGLIIRFENNQKAVAKGQFAAWYTDDVLVGSGVIS